MDSAENSPALSRFASAVNASSNRWLDPTACARTAGRLHERVARGVPARFPEPQVGDLRPYPRHDTAGHHWIRWQAKDQQ
jgi:hypothetical protein